MATPFKLARAVRSASPFRMKTLATKVRVSVSNVAKRPGFKKALKYIAAGGMGLVGVGAAGLIWAWAVSPEDEESIDSPDNPGYTTPPELTFYGYASGLVRSLGNGNSSFVRKATMNEAIKALMISISNDPDSKFAIACLRHHYLMSITGSIAEGPVSNQIEIDLISNSIDDLGVGPSTWHGIDYLSSLDAEGISLLPAHQFDRAVTTRLRD